MDRTLYRAASEGEVNVLRQHIDQLEIRTTANRNTALHVAAQFGQSQCVAEIFQVCPSLLCRENIRGETPLHMAAREGYADIVKALIERAKTIEQELESGLGGAVKKMLRATNVDGDTALHMAVRNCHLEKDKYLEVVKLLTREDPEFQHPANHADETPLYLAAERGYYGVAVLFTLLNTCTSPTYGGPGGRTALHAATLNDFTGSSVRRLLEWKKDLIEEVDTCGWTPLHCAAYNGNEEGVRQLLQIDESVAYVTTTKKDGLETALHMATARGHVSVMTELLSSNPDCWEMVNSKGQNVLHIAVAREDESAIKFILNKPWLRHLINQKDNEGNTPLHLLVSSDSEVYELWEHRRADRRAFNDKNMTPADIGWSTIDDARMPTFAATYIVVDRFLDSRTLAGRNMLNNVDDHIVKLKRARKHVKDKGKIIKEAEKQREEEKRTTEEEKRKAEVDEKRAKDEEFAREFQTVVIVAALIATISFAAAFAIPGGYNGNQGRDQGLAVLEKTAAFKAFVVTNTIAVVCSVTSIFLCFIASFYTSEPEPDSEDLVAHRFLPALILILVAMFAMMLAYIAAAFAVLAHSLALAVSTCIIACITFIVYFFEIKNCCCWFVRIAHSRTSQARAV